MSTCVRAEGSGTPERLCRDDDAGAGGAAEQEERTQQIASVIENLTPMAEARTQGSWRTDQTERTRYLTCFCCPESETAMKTLVWVDTAREQRDTHFSRAREGEVACERETRQLLSVIMTATRANVAEAKGAEVADNTIRRKRSCYHGTAAMSMKDELESNWPEHLSRTLKVFKYMRQSGAMLWLPRRPPTFYCSRAVARCNNEVRRTVRIRQARERDMRGR